MVVRGNRLLLGVYNFCVVLSIFILYLAFAILLLRAFALAAITLYFFDGNATLIRLNSAHNWLSVRRRASSLDTIS